MANRAYSEAFKRSAVAYGAIVGAEIAAKELGIGGKDTLRNWMLAAGVDPRTIVAEPDEWRSLGALALAKAHALVASGKTSAVQLATVAGISARNASKPEPAITPATDAEAWVDDVVRMLTERYHDSHLEDLALMALIDWMEGREDDETFDPGVADAVAYLDSIGDLDEWSERHHAERSARTAEQLAANQAAKQAAQRASLDAETTALLDAAERWLQSNTQGDPDA